MDRFEDYEMLRKHSREWKNGDIDEDDNLVVGVTLTPGGMVYYYFTRSETLARGDMLLVRTPHETTEVTITGYYTADRFYQKATRALDVVKRLTVPKYQQLRTKKITGKRPTQTIIDDLLGGEEMRKSTTTAIKNAINDSKDTMVSVQKGNAVLRATHSTVAESGLVNAKLAGLIGDNKDVVDMVLGVALQACASIFTDSQLIKQTAADVNMAGASKASHGFTLIQDLIEMTITRVLSGEMKVDGDVVSFAGKGSEKKETTEK